MGKIKSLRKGPTGIGYTFETLLGKKEDQLSLPDYKDIEIKCRNGYSKCDLGLFSCSPKKEGYVVATYIFQKYSYHFNNNPNLYRLFSRKIYSNYQYELNNYSFMLNVNYLEQKLYLKSYYKGSFCENVCFWEFDDLKNILYTKMSKLAIVEGYPFRTKNDVFYKYYNIKFYKIKNFELFLKLIEKGEIYVKLYLREGVNKLGDYVIKNNGFSFKLRLNHIKDLFSYIIVS